MRGLVTPIFVVSPEGAKKRGSMIHPQSAKNGVQLSTCSHIYIYIHVCVYIYISLSLFLPFMSIPFQNALDISSLSVKFGQKLLWQSTNNIWYATMYDVGALTQMHQGSSGQASKALLTLLSTIKLPSAKMGDFYLALARRGEDDFFSLGSEWARIYHMMSVHHIWIIANRFNRKHLMLQSRYRKTCPKAGGPKEPQLKSRWFLHETLCLKGLVQRQQNHWGLLRN